MFSICRDCRSSRKRRSYNSQSPFFCFLHALRISAVGAIRAGVQTVFTQDTDPSQLGVNKKTGQFILLYENENSVVIREQTSKRLLILEGKAIIVISLARRTLPRARGSGWVCILNKSERVRIRALC